jgi:hypothetical protein
LEDGQDASDKRRTPELWAAANVPVRLVLVTVALTSVVNHYESNPLLNYSFQKNSNGMIACVLVFISFFEFSSGPIVWLYNAEIMRDKAIAIATFLNWLISLFISVCIPYLVKKFDIGWIF